ncbi:DNA (cytosine-5)-methyltransferase 1 [Lentzea atacamensis]|uniref:DNA (Cytosine-5)-methyltransferase 1 n=1 Tax=Lentzea atacamensis TaxID=531938 RepID=A0ABX9DV10_9PSEU|nr:DNA cytosine methyltransferase [Lentzea atacamensis]RAS58873.1 DNA (cytosine-5)-methyltransferase 1 [Lentzea atacamensis]
MNRPRLLDLFCRAGGASAGYHAAGFDVTGVDIEPQPHYPFPFIQADALTVDLSGYDVIAASAPCQRFSQATPRHRRDAHPDLLDPVRTRLRKAVERGDAWGYVIENVPGAPMHDPITICGETLRLGVRRHRLFESNLPLFGTPCHHDRGTPAVPVYGRPRWQTSSVPTDVAREAMGIDWMPWTDLTQAIPPAYTAWIGVQLIGHARQQVTQAARLRVTQAARTETSHAVEPQTSRGDATHELDGPELMPSVTTRSCRCGTPLRRPPTGRWPLHCSQACRQAAYRERTKGTAA